MKLSCDALIQCVLVLLILYLIDVSSCKKLTKFLKHAKNKQQIFKELRDEQKSSGMSCTRHKRRGDKLQHLIRHPRDTRYNTKPTEGVQNAVYFSGKEILKLKAFYSNIPSNSFTLSLTINPEGGQHDPVTILELIDICNGKQTNSWFNVGIGSDPESHKSAQRLFTTLKTERNKISSTLYSNIKYKPGAWTQIDVTYNSTVLKLYIDGAMVAATKHQQGPVFQEVSRSCKTLLIAGDEPSKTFYRGFVTGLKLWNYAKSHSEIKQSNNFSEKNPKLLFYDDFNDVHKWRPLFKDPPRIIKIRNTSNSKNILLTSPPCGETVCDDPVLVMSYKHNKHMRDRKEINYKVFNIMNDDGSNPQITRKQLHKQHIALLTAFLSYNITFKLDTKNIRNTTLRKAIVLYTCDPKSIGDGVCNEECFHTWTGNDGGDCDHVLPVVPECKMKQVGNGNCDPECNKFVWNWDGGDCCTSVSTSCYNPQSIYRNYMSKEEFKTMIGEDSSSQLNIYLASKWDSQLAGLSTYPWDKNIYRMTGGIVVPPESYGAKGKLKGLVHEIGHVLGLWHVHHGISEMNCDDPCFETHASMELGDLCADTAPTPDNYECNDPVGTESTCGVQTFKNTPFRNYMSYSDDACTDSFTLEQSARMHCYLDLVYQPWRSSKKPSPVPLSPKIVASTNESVTISWLPPLGTKQAVPKSICDICTADGRAIQYAYRAAASHPEQPLYMWQPQEATGQPDAEVCTASDKAWMMPDSYTCNRMECFIDLQFNFKFIPNKLKVWVTYAGSIDEDILTEMGDPIQSIEITTDDNVVISLGAFPVSCDTVSTVRLNVRKPVIKVRIYVPHAFTAIDAVELSTAHASPECQFCRQQKYKVTRELNFNDNHVMHTSETEFTDRGLEANTTYTYRVYAMAGNREGVPSPPVDFMIGQAFCGDGSVNGGEDCDDGNTDDGDGCDLFCKVEEFFKCTGEPSHCFVHDGDGICEEYEKPYSVKDCGHYTPPDWEDQWAVSAVANPEFQDSKCPSSLVTGIPAPNQKCVSNTVPKEYWSPCNNIGKEDDYWIEVFFVRPKVATAIIIHLGSDGVDVLNKKQHIVVELLTSDNTTKAISPESQSLSCSHNPVKIPIIHDLTKPFFLSKGIRIRFSSPRISIAGVRLRSYKYLNPVAIESCDAAEMYDPDSSTCFNQSCNRPTCGHLRIKHGVPSCNGLNEGDVCKVSCKIGYQLDGLLNEFICVNGKWKSYAPVSCKPVYCGEPYIPYGVLTCPDGFQLGNKCTFYCKPPAKLKGDVSTIQCDADGTWSLPNAFCQIHCKAPSVKHGAKLMTKNCKRGYHTLGKVCKLKCEKEFKVESKSRIRRMFKLECSEDGSWKGEQCIPITCSPPDIVFKGLYSCTDKYNAGSSCIMICPDNSGKQLITCKTDGTWTRHFNVCSSAINGTCPSVSDSRNVKFNCNGNTVGNECGVNCFLPNAIPIINGHSNKVRGRLAGTTNPDHSKDAVTKVTCSALLEWIPDPETIACKETCNEDHIGDGLCQAEYNTKECSWDGGDCCDSTVFDGMVISIPYVCGKPCSCKDPNATENRKSRHKDKSRDRTKSKAKYKHLVLSRYSYKNSRPHSKKTL